VGQEPPPFNPTSPISSSDLIGSPVNGAEREGATSSSGGLGVILRRISPEAD